MRWSIRIARVAGIEVKIHVTFLLLLAWIAVASYQRGGAFAAWQGVVLILLLFGSVLLHEFGHALAARRYGIHTPDITLLPIGGVARLARMPDDPRQELVVALAGPAVNVAIAGVLYLALGTTTDLSVLARLGDPRVGMLAKLFSANVMLVLFNLVPAFPMDGGRVLRAALAMRTSHLRATRIAATLGQGIALVFGFIGLLGNPLLVLIAVFVYMGATQEAAFAQMRSVTQRIAVSAAMVTEFRALPPDATLAEATEALLRSSQHDFPVLDADGHLHGMVTRDTLMAALTRGGTDQPVTAAMRTDLPTVSAHAPFDEAFQRMQESRSPVLPVVNDFGRLVGMIDPDRVSEMIRVDGALARGKHPSWRSGARADPPTVPAEP